MNHPYKKLNELNNKLTIILVYTTPGGFPFHRISKVCKKILHVPFRPKRLALFQIIHLKIFSNCLKNTFLKIFFSFHVRQYCTEQVSKQKHLLIVGLGNPGKEYENNRHNVGFMCVDEFARKHNLKWNKHYISHSCEIEIGDNLITLVKPQSYMNLSGGVVKSYIRQNKIPIQSCLVIYDAAHVPFGTIKLKRQGSGGGHNGVQNIIDLMKANNFGQLRIGIGSPMKGSDIKDFVLADFSRSEMHGLKVIISQAERCIESWIVHGYEPTMKEFNNLDLLVTKE